ncbi:amidinotransferase [Pseudolysobacter antarcticus]|uniref:Amidinotransferase n=1 Tax=Pseudolysobacter antarcticus TaxID=2511995 RepID=A0A411HG48_9GAMM|nr:arginine deiminase-related protein [Pseudolysobacter antarcticus]QBB69473.1 amidinotransferase [Pseudolysobacter antarcticus]
MIVTSVTEFLAVFSEQRFPMQAPPCARAAFLCSPLGFALATQSAQDNRYMDLSQHVDPARALAQHAQLAAALSQELPVITFPGDPATPDAVFPNNVFATIHGRLIVGAMRHAVRQREAARPDIRAFFRDNLGYEVLDLSGAAQVAELTGALVIDRARGIGFCGLSERCDMAGARAMHDAFGLNLTFCFELAASEYHTNVVLAILAGRAAVVAPLGFADAAVPAAIAQVYAGRAITLDDAQKTAFAGNAIALTPGSVWFSAVAAAALHSEQRQQLQAWGFALRCVELDEIEKAGGSLRCCVGEIF